MGISKLLFRGQLLERNVSAELTERIHGTDIVPYYPLMKLLEWRRKDPTTVEYPERSEGSATSRVLFVCLALRLRAQSAAKLKRIRILLGPVTPVARD